MSKGRSRDGVWKYSYGVRPYVVFAMERRDRAGHIAVRWTNPDKTGKFRRERKTLGITVRDPETGRLDRRRVRVAELAVQQFQAKLVVGQPAGKNALDQRAKTPGSVVEHVPQLLVIAVDVADHMHYRLGQRETGPQ